MEYRLVAIWDRGGYISSLDNDFTENFSQLVEQYGKPDWISCRETNYDDSDENYHKGT